MAVLGGGGLTSMVRTTCIILIAACYSGIFKATGLLDFLIVPLRRLAQKGGSFASMLVASVFSAMVSCNQTLAIMLTDQMTAKLTEDPLLRAQYLENSAVVISPLIPWCIACSVPLSSVEAPSASVLFAFYLFIGLIVIHDYNFSQGIGMVLLTLFAIIVIVFVLMLGFSLVADVWDFLSVVWRELQLKL